MKHIATRLERVPVTGAEEYDDIATFRCAVWSKLWNRFFQSPSSPSVGTSSVVRFAWLHSRVPRQIGERSQR